MNKKQRTLPLVSAITAALILPLLLPGTSFAYVDPNTGGAIFQILFPIITVITTGWLVFKKKIRELLTRLRGNKDQQG